MVVVWQRVTLILGILFIIAIAYISVDFYNEKQDKKRQEEQQRLLLAYRQGVANTQGFIAQQMVQQLNTQGFIILNVPTQDNQTETIKLAPQK